MVVDHPDDTEVFVDERFAQERAGVDDARDEDAAAGGAGVGRIGPRRDGPRHAAGRPLSRDVRARRVSRASRRIISSRSISGARFRAIRGCGSWPAGGSIRPTAASTSRSARGTRVQPRGLSLEAQDRSGRWVVVSPDLGFPAGKNKTILIDLSQVTAAGVAHARRLRLRTNLEVYWDRLAVADGIETRALSTSRLQPERAELRYRGFSQTDYSNRRQPEIPVYDRIANVTQRWRDLVGYYTRFGDVRELLGGVDDRYVIMNAGDELQLSFRAPAPPAHGLDARFRARRRRLGEGRRLQHDVFEDRPAAAASRSAGLRVVSRRRARRRSGLSSSSAGLADLPHPVRDARRLPAVG